MKRWVAFVAIVVIVFLIGYTGYVYYYRASFLATALSHEIREHVKIQDVSFSKDGLTIKQMCIHNPPNSSLKNAFVADTIFVEISWGSLLKSFFGMSSTKIVVDKIEISRPQIAVELFTLDGSDNNWTRIINRMTTKVSEDDGRKFVIEKFIMNDIQLEIKNNAVSKKILRPKVPLQLELENLGSENPLTVKQIFFATTKALISEIAKSQGIEALSKDLKDVSEIMKSIFSQDSSIENTEK